MRQRGAFRVLWFGQFSSVAGLTVVVPLLPFYLAGLGTAPAQVPLWTGISLAAPAAAQIVSSPLWGAVGDRWGRKAMVVRAHAGLALSVGLMALAETPGQFLACRVVQGTFGGVVAATAAYASTLVRPDRRGRALGGLFSATAVGSLLGPLVGGVLTGWYGFATLFVVVAGLLVVGALLAALVLVEPEVSSPSARPVAALRQVGAQVMASGSARTMVAAGLCAQAGMFALVVVFAPQVERATGSFTAAVAWVGILQASTWAASATTASWWGRRHDRRSAAGGFALAALGCSVAVALQAVPMPPEALIPVRVVQGACFAALVPAVLHVATRLGPVEGRGAVTGLTTSFLDVGQVIGPVLGALAAVLLPTAAVFGAIGGLFALAALLALRSAAHQRAARPVGSPVPTPPASEVRR